MTIAVCDVQGVRHRSDVVTSPSESTICEDPTQILLRGRLDALGVLAVDDEAVGDLVMALEHGPDVVPVVSLLLEGDDELRLIPSEVVYVIAASHKLDAAYARFEAGSS